MTSPTTHGPTSSGPGLIDLGALEEGVVVASHDLRVQRVSRSATEALGWTDAAAGLHLAESLWAALEPATIAGITDVLAAGQRWEGPLGLTSAGGATVPALVSVSASHGEAGLPEGVVVVVRPADRPALLAPDEGGEPVEGFCVAGLPGRFLLHHRPEVDVADSVVTACEAELRWWHPGLGLVSPGRALREAYGADQLAAVEIWTLFAACRKAAAWAELDRPVRLSVSLSGRRLADRDLLRRVTTALASSGAPAPCLAIRMPGPAFSAMPREAHRVARALAEEGVATIVDDVTGPLAPSVLDPGHVAGVSLHHSLTDMIDTADGQDAVAAVVARAHAAGAVVTARGIESLDQLDLARALGCDQASGDVLSPPLAPADVWPLLGQVLDPSSPPPTPTRPAPADDVLPVGPVAGSLPSLAEAVEAVTS